MPGSRALDCGGSRPRSGGCVAARIRSVLLEDLPHCGGGDFDAEGGELAVDATVAPAGVLQGQAQDKGLDRAAGSWAAGVLAAEALAWRRRMRSRCQRKMVSGATIRCSCLSLGRGSRCRRAASRARSVRVIRGLLVCRCRMAGWWHRARISMSLSVSLIGNSRMTVNTLLRARKGSRSSTIRYLGAPG